MKQRILILLLIISESVFSQMNWSEYSTSFQNFQQAPSLGVAIPYNGNYDNLSKSIVGISHWNPQDGLNIDSKLTGDIPLFFVYDTTGIFFLLPMVTQANTNDFEVSVLLNNKTILTPWSHVNQFTQVAVGQMKAGSGITESFYAPVGQYLVASLRNKSGRIISSIVIYFTERAPQIQSFSTSDDAHAFEKVLADKNPFTQSKPDLGWHRTFIGNVTASTHSLKLSSAENNVLIELDPKIYKREAIEYRISNEFGVLREWRINEVDNHYILIKDADPGNYTVSIRYTTQPARESKFYFELARHWYQTVAFKVTVPAIMFLGIAAFLIVRKSRRRSQSILDLKKKADDTTEELESIQALLNPHFTFNALNSIQALVNKGDLDAASRYLASFGELLRESLRVGRMNQIPVTKELQNLALYVSLEQLRYQFKYQLNVENSLDLSLLMLPPFLLQPFVENAIKHGVSQMNGSGEINLDVSSNGDAMVIRITDNGPGIDAERFKEGYGLGLSRKRIELLNAEYGEKLINLQFGTAEKKTSVILSFENWL